jgi:hypothetical protein
MLTFRAKFLCRAKILYRAKILSDLRRNLFRDLFKQIMFPMHLGLNKT